MTVRGRQDSAGGGAIGGLRVVVLSECPACGHPHADVVLTKPDDLLSGDGLVLRRCRGCSLVYLNPRLTGSALAQLEDESAVYNLPADQVEARIADLQRMLSGLERFAPRRGRLLDVGCGPGFLLEASRREGWTATGVEVSAVAAGRARSAFRADVVASFVGLAGRGPFDLVVAWHVLEHATDPVALLRRVAAVLVPDGVVAIQVPSFAALAEFARREQLAQLVCAVHNSYFTEATLRGVVMRAGLAPAWIRDDPSDLMLTAICGRALPRPYC